MRHVVACGNVYISLLNSLILWHLPHEIWTTSQVCVSIITKCDCNSWPRKSKMLIIVLKTSIIKVLTTFAPVRGSGWWWDVPRWDGGGGGIRAARCRAWSVLVTQLVARCEWADAFSQLSRSSVYKSSTAKQQLVLLCPPGYSELKYGSLNLWTCWNRKEVVLCSSNAPSSALQFFCKNGVSETLYSLYSCASLLLCCCC